MWLAGIVMDCLQFCTFCCLVDGRFLFSLFVVVVVVWLAGILWLRRFHGDRYEESSAERVRESRLDGFIRSFLFFL